MTVHAHPDDEVVFTGGLLARYAGEGLTTVLVMCTNGEEGEIHDPDLDPEAAKPHLGTIRRGELRCAIEHLDITHTEFLDYRDSGMAGTEPNANPACFHQADKDEAADRLVALVRRYRPQVLVTYDENGAYGHPDHIAANVITHRAFDRAGDPAYRPDLGEPFQPSKLYYTAWNEEGWKQARAMYLERGLKWPWEEEEQQDAEPERESGDEEARDAEAAAEAQPPAYVPPPVTTRIDVRPWAAQKREAVLCHRTQFSADGLFRTMPEDIALVAWGEEHLSLVRPAMETETPLEEDDLFAGLRG
jgi:N-acetyl-1-D-myo-inositol-2-amino-2-deoxy-alpha-D-glucopyranoside deacetylase